MSDETPTDSRHASRVVFRALSVEAVLMDSIKRCLSMLTAVEEENDTHEK